MELIEAVSLPRKARLGSNLIKYTNSTQESIEKWEDFLVNSFQKIETKYQVMFLSNYILGLTSHMDSLFSDCLNDLYFCFPKKLGSITTKVNEVFEYGNIYLNMQNVIDKKIMDFLYKSFEDQILILNDELLNSSIPLNLINEIAEIKATRDLIAHGEKTYNDTYLRKAGTMARGEIDKKIVINYEYALTSTQNIKKLVSEIKASIKKSYIEWDKRKAFKAMWENSHMERIIEFKDAWEYIEKEDMVRPKDLALNWYWSHSEKLLFKFFLAIYKGLQDVDLDILYFFSKWPYDTFEATLLLSWLQCPFYF